MMDWENRNCKSKRVPHSPTWCYTSLLTNLLNYLIISTKETYIERAYLFTFSSLLSIDLITKYVHTSCLLTYLGVNQKFQNLYLEPTYIGT